MTTEPTDAAPVEQTLEQWIAEVDEQSELMEVNKTQLWEKAKEAQAKFDPEKKNPAVLWRLAKCTYKAASDAEVAGDKKRHKELLLEALQWADSALALEPENGEAHAWAAYTCGKLSDHLGTKERIQKGKQVEQHLQKAIEADPTKYSLHFALGRWSMEVAKLSWMERKIASTLFEAVPEASYEDAIGHFETCDGLKPEWRACLYWKAKSLIALKKYADAIKVLDAAAACAPIDSEDQVVEADMKSLIGKYGSYR